MVVPKVGNAPYAPPKTMIAKKINAVERTPESPNRSEEHTSELQSRFDLVCRLLLEKKKTWSDGLPPCASVVSAPTAAPLPAVLPRPTTPTLFPYTTLFRSKEDAASGL